MTAFYNDSSPFVCDWLQNLIDAGHLPPGVVDSRDVRELQPEDLDGFEHVHLFAGIGGWAYALKLAGWPDDRTSEPWATPCARDGEGPGSAEPSGRRESSDPGCEARPLGNSDLATQAKLAAWPTVTETDSSEAARATSPAASERSGNAGTNLVDAARYAHGALEADRTGSPATTPAAPSGGRLNPDLCRWLIGFPAAWGRCAPTGTPSSPSSPPSSPGRSSEPSP